MYVYDDHKLWPHVRQNSNNGNHPRYAQYSTYQVPICSLTTACISWPPRSQANFPTRTLQFHPHCSLTRTSIIRHVHIIQREYYYHIIAIERQTLASLKRAIKTKPRPGKSSTFKTCRFSHLVVKIGRILAINVTTHFFFLQPFFPIRDSSCNILSTLC